MPPSEERLGRDDKMREGLMDLWISLDERSEDSVLYSPPPVLPDSGGLTGLHWTLLDSRQVTICHIIVTSCHIYESVC
jgi:hypothetical protein